MRFSGLPMSWNDIHHGGADTYQTFSLTLLIALNKVSFVSWTFIYNSKFLVNQLIGNLVWKIMILKNIKSRNLYLWSMVRKIKSFLAKLLSFQNINWVRVRNTKIKSERLYREMDRWHWVVIQIIDADLPTVLLIIILKILLLIK